MNFRTNTTRRIAAAFATSTCLAMATTGCDASADDDTLVEDVEEAGTEGLILGETVTITGEVNLLISSTSFTMGGGDTLVYGAEPFAVLPGDEVSVSGEVIEFVVAEVETRIGVDLEESLYVDYENELAVEAEDVTVVDGG